MCRTVDPRTGHLKRDLHVTQGEKNAIHGALVTFFRDHPTATPFNILGIEKRIYGALDTLRCNNAKQIPQAIPMLKKERM